MLDAQTYKVSKRVLLREVDDGAVLLDLDGGVYFGLDPLGLQIWQLLKEQHSFAHICDLLQDRFDIDRKQVKADVSIFLTDLQKHGLISTSDQNC